MSEIEEFWSTIFGDGEGVLCAFSGGRLAGEKRLGRTTQQFFSYPSARGSAAEWLEAESKAGRETYFCAHLLTREERKKDAAARLFALYVDGDGAKVPTGLPPASVVVESSPGREHFYWVLSASVAPERGERLNKRLAQAMGADKSGFDLTQLLRPPGTTNWKYPGGAAVVLRVFTDVVYDIAELERMVPELPEVPRRPAIDAGEPPVRLGGKALDIWRGEQPKVRDGGAVDRSASLVAIGGVLARAGATRLTIRQALRDRDQALGWRKYADRHDSDEQYDAIVDLVEHEKTIPRVSLTSGLISPSSLVSQGLSEPEWPSPPGDALWTGLAGEIVWTVSPFTEADPMALLVNFLGAFGNVIGTGPHTLVGATAHTGREYFALVGKSSKARKGDSWQPIHKLFELATPEWLPRVVNGLSTGEGVIWNVRDPVEGRVPIKEKGKTVGYETAIVDEGVVDKRLLIVEPELARVLKVMSRQGNSLSPVLRSGWDSGDLQILTKTSPARATGAHISLIAHITMEELKRELSDVEAANGFANRFGWICVKRSKDLPEPEPFAGPIVTKLAGTIVRAVEAARSVDGMERDAAARELWLSIYSDLARERDGLAGGLLARAEAHVLRYSMLFALLEGQRVITLAHLTAALELWGYAERSVGYLFGDATGSPIADAIHAALKARGEMSRTELSALFGRHESAQAIQQALQLLQGKRLAAMRVEETGGRPLELWRLMQ